MPTLGPLSRYWKSEFYDATMTAEFRCRSQTEADAKKMYQVGPPW